MPSLITAADLDFALQDISGSMSPNVSYGAQSCFGQLKRMPVEAPDGDGITRIGVNITLTIRDGALTGLAVDAPISVDDVDFLIRDAGDSLSDNSRIITVIEV